MPTKPNPANLVAALKAQPVAQDQFKGSDFPGSYLWQRGGMPSEEFHEIKAAKNAMPKGAKPKIVPVHGVKNYAR